MDIAPSPRDVFDGGFGWIGAVSGSAVVDFALLTLLILGVYVAGRALARLCRRAPPLRAGFIVAVSAAVGLLAALVGGAIIDAHSPDREAARTCFRFHDLGSRDAAAAASHLRAMQELCRNVAERQAAEARRRAATPAARLLAERVLAGFANPASLGIAIVLAVAAWFGLSRLFRGAGRRQEAAARGSAGDGPR